MMLDGWAKQTLRSRICGETEYSSRMSHALLGLSLHLWIRSLEIQKIHLQKKVLRPSPPLLCKPFDGYCMLWGGLIDGEAMAKLC